MEDSERYAALGKLASTGLEKNRLEALTDGILAVAMTILVLDIKIEANDAILTDSHLIQHLLEVERTFSVYLVSFVVLAMFWISHTLQFHYVKRVDRRMLWISLVFMLLVTLVPFTTNLLISYETLLLPVVLYGVNLGLLAATLIANVNYLSRHPGLATGEFTPTVSAYIHRRLAIVALIPVAAIAMSFVSTRISLYMYFLMLLVHFLPREVDNHLPRWFRKDGS
jgi:uncharacterized membrane protein